MSDPNPAPSSELPIVRTEASSGSNPPVMSPNIPATQSAEPRLLFNPSIDIYETADGLVLYADLPGVTVEGLELQVQDNRLTLYGRVSKKEPEGSHVLHEEYQIGDFLRSFILSDEVDHERIQAKLTNGLLRVELPRAPRSKPRRIEVSRE